MPLQCPECQRASLKIGPRIEIPPDGRSDEIMVQILVCSVCRFAGLGVYQESRRGGLDDESVDHVAYRVPPADLKHIRQLIRACPHPRDRRCQCPSHLKLGSRDASGRWNGLAEFNLSSPANLILR